MKIIYTLSDGQRKELLIRGTPVRLALPVPPIDIDDAADWARSVLPSEFRPLVSAAEEMEIRVNPQIRSDAGLASLLGQIMEVRATSARHWCVTHAVVVVTLTPAKARHPAGSLRWPADVVIDGAVTVRTRR